MEIGIVGPEARIRNIIDGTIPAICDEYDSNVWTREEALVLIEKWRKAASGLILETNGKKRKLSKELQEIVEACSLSIEEICQARQLEEAGEIYPKDETYMYV